MTDLCVYLERLAETPLASAVTNLKAVRSALSKLDKPDESSIETIERSIVKLSPELFAFLFKQANLPESDEPISEQLAAVIGKLGFRRVKRLIFFHVAYSSNIAENASAMDRDFAAKLWTFNYRVACVADYWAAKVLEESPEELFYLAMLQNIGISALATLEPSKHRALRESMRKVPLAQKEQEHFGFTHYDLGLAIVEQWRLPKIHGAAMRFEQTHGQIGFGFAEEKHEELFSLLYFARYRSERRKPSGASGAESRFLVDPYFDYNTTLLQIVADRIRDVA